MCPRRRRICSEITLRNPMGKKATFYLLIKKARS